MARRDDDYWRERAAVLYRALRDDYGARGAAVRDLMPLIGSSDTAGVFMTLSWMRQHGVRIVCARDRGYTPPSTPEERAERHVPAPSRWALRESLPPEWDTMLPADGSELELVGGPTMLSEVVDPSVSPVPVPMQPTGSDGMDVVGDDPARV